MSALDFRYVNTPLEIKRFIQFGIEVYRDNPHFRDSMSDIVSMFVHKRSSYLSHGEVYPFIIEQEGQILVRAAFVFDRKQVDMLMIAFFEAKPNAQAAVDLMLAKAKEHAANQGLRRIVVGLDAHLNYGVGFLASHHGVDPCFGFGFTHEYYLAYFQGLKEHRFTSFQVDIEQFNLAREQKILARIKRNGYSFRFADFKRLDREIEIYTRLNNACFQNHLWWADRTFSEDKELLYPFRWFINGENLIIAEKQGEPIGFMLWYPDFNQLISPGAGIGVGTLLKAKLGFGSKIDRIKIAEIAIKPEFQGAGVILGLFDMLYRCTGNKYKYCEAGWIEENNIKSKGFGIRWGEEYKRYKAFEVAI